MTDAEWERLKRIAYALEQVANEMEQQRNYQAKSRMGGAPNANHSRVLAITNQLDESKNQRSVVTLRT